MGDETKDQGKNKRDVNIPDVPRNPLRLDQKWRNKTKINLGTKAFCFHFIS